MIGSRALCALPGPRAALPAPDTSGADVRPCRAASDHKPMKERSKTTPHMPMAIADVHSANVR